jgi:hypothetical protein
MALRLTRPSLYVSEDVAEGCLNQALDRVSGRSLAQLLVVR